MDKIILDVININTLLSALIGLFMIYLNFRFSALKERIQELKSEIDLVKQESNENKNNYINKFDKMSNDLHMFKEEIIKEFSKVNLSVEKQLSYVTLVLEHKKENEGRITELERRVNKITINQKEA